MISNLYICIVVPTLQLKAGVLNSTTIPAPKATIAVLYLPTCHNRSAHQLATVNPVLIS